ncbi:MAG: DUF4255 domain-containing protein [Winogradskyella sp.]|nr:MAG: DUF4255 domain-containing protein [Winogradskyella sp.]
MIDKALQFTNQTLEQFLKFKLGLDENVVVTNSIIDVTGTLSKLNQNKIVLTLINLKRETIKPFYVRQKRVVNGYSDKTPVERYNLDLLVTSNFDHYKETLKFLNDTILFFQINPVLNSNTSSNIPSGLLKLEFELESIDFHQMHSLWNAMGAKYQPSVIYKMRLITLDANQTEGFESDVLQTSNSLSV